MGVLGDVLPQLYYKPPYPDTDFSGKTVIVTGANIGLGIEAVKHFVRLNAKTVIGAVRSIAKGEAAKAEVEAETKRAGVVEMWELDLCSYASVEAFAARVARLERVDAVVLNAGVAMWTFGMSEDNETTITVNVVSTTLLILLLLPTLRSSAAKWGIVPVISVVGSGVHKYTEFPERNTPNSLATLNNEKKANMPDRYPVSKLLQLFAVREIAHRIAKKEPFVVINTLSPGLCQTALTRNASGRVYYTIEAVKALVAWTAEQGSRTLVHAVTAGPESHGIYINLCKIHNNDMGKFVTKPKGREAQKKVWGELTVRLEAIHPGITKDL